MRPRSLPAAALVVVLLGCALAAQAKRSITETDLFQFTWIGDPQVSPDGSSVAFVRVSVNAKKDGYDTALFVVATAGDEPPRQLTTGPRDSWPRWSPDGTRLVFMRALERDGKPLPPQLYLLSMRGGEPAPLTDLPKGAAGPKWSPDGTRIAFKSETSPQDLQPREAREPRECLTENAQNSCLDATRESDMRTITRAIYRSNDEGYLDPTRPAHIWVVEASAAPPDARTAKQITQGAWEENDFVWSIDGRQIYFTKSHLQESYYELPKSDLVHVVRWQEDSRLGATATGLSIGPDVSAHS